jgi:hypothetical protein
MILEELPMLLEQLLTKSITLYLSLLHYIQYPIFAKSIQLLDQIIFTAD